MLFLWLTIRSDPYTSTVLILVAENTLDFCVDRKCKAFVLALGSPGCTGAVLSFIKGDSATVVALVLGLFAGKV
jgi:hypothetical protein